MLYNKLRVHKEIIKELTMLGVIPMKVLRDIEIFEFYNSLSNDLGAYAKYEIAGEKFKLSSDTVKAIILKLNK